MDKTMLNGNSFEQLEAIFKLELSDKYPQYRHLLNGSVRVVGALRTYKGGRITPWYTKGDLLLAFGEDKVENVWNKETKKFDKPVTFTTIYSPGIKGMCSAPASHLKLIERVK